MQLRQFPHVTRAFNLNRGELDARVLEHSNDGALTGSKVEAFPGKFLVTMRREVRRQDLGKKLAS